jgi:hypothetical protein
MQSVIARQAIRLPLSPQVLLLLPPLASTASGRPPGQQRRLDRPSRPRSLTRALAMTSSKGECCCAEGSLSDPAVAGCQLPLWAAFRAQ